MKGQKASHQKTKRKMVISAARCPSCLSNAACSCLSNAACSFCLSNDACCSCCSYQPPETHGAVICENTTVLLSLFSRENTTVQDQPSRADLALYPAYFLLSAWRYNAGKGS